MNCEICHGDTRVLKTVDTERRRECTRCGNRFVTVEVLKEDQRRKDQLLRQAKALAEGLAEVG